MRKALFAVVVLVFLVSVAPTAQRGTALNNSHVVKFVEAKLPPELIVASIKQATARDFDTSPEALIELKEKGVPDVVIAAMLLETLSASPRTESAPPKYPAELKAEGIYLEVGEGENAELTELMQGKTTGMRVNAWKSAFTMGVAKSTTKYRIRDAVAEIRVANSQPIFYVSKMDPRDIMLMKLEKKGNEREFEAARVGGLTGSFEGPKEGIPFTYERLSPGVHRITPEKPLEPGEYGFGIIGSGGMGMILFVYDFGVDSPHTSTSR